jgi:transposase-like protein
MKQTSIAKEKNKVNNVLLAGLKNLREGISGVSIDQFVISTLELLMHLERDEHLAKLKESTSKDKGNGTYPRSFKSLSRNSLMINIPRTRYGDFKPYAMEFLKYSQEQVNELVLTLYTKGLTTRDVSDVLTNFFGNEMSYAQVSNLAESFHELRVAWENSPLETRYKVIYCDAIYITVRRGDSYSKEAVHIMYGVRQDNKRELLNLSINPTESSSSWAEAFEKCKQRGIKQVDLIVADGLKGLEEEVHKAFPGTVFQKCVVHKMRYMLNKVRPKDKQEFANDLKHVFDNFDKDSNLQEAQAKTDAFIAKWGNNYAEVVASLANETIEYYFSYIKFPASVRRMIYSTNSIESLNKKIRKATKNKQSFEKPDRVLDYLFAVIRDFESENWMRYPVSLFSNWTQLT